MSGRSKLTDHEVSLSYIAREIKSLRILALTDLTSMHFKLKHFKCISINLQSGKFRVLILKKTGTFIYFTRSILKNFKCI